MLCENYSLERMEQAAHEMIWACSWKPVDVDTVNQCLTSSALQHTCLTDGTAVVQLLLDEDGETCFGLAVLPTAEGPQFLLTESRGLLQKGADPE